MGKLNVGDAAPDFELTNQSGEPVRLSSFRGRHVLLYFYPRADTPGCTAQSCAVRDARPDFESLAVEVLGLSPDDQGDQAAFDQKYDLGFPLLSDPGHTVADAYGAWGEQTYAGNTYTGIIRSSFLVSPEGTLVGVWSPVKPLDTVPNALEALEAIGAH
ncbi:MAG: thioredoxin-dependent thiol peroxidase [Candidatus Dormibacteria bacterium]